MTTDEFNKLHACLAEIEQRVASIGASPGSDAMLSIGEELAEAREILHAAEQRAVEADMAAWRKANEVRP